MLPADTVTLGAVTEMGPAELTVSPEGPIVTVTPCRHWTVTACMTVVSCFPFTILVESFMIVMVLS
jgi:hypothetical protein